MAIFKVRLVPKIGDLLYDKANLDAIQHLYDTVSVGIYHPMLAWRLDGAGPPKWEGAYYTFIKKMMSWLFSDKNYEVHHDETPPYGDEEKWQFYLGHRHLTWHEICEEHHVDPVKPRLRSYLVPVETDLPADYVVAMTKSVWFEPSDFLRDAAPIWKALRAKAEQYPVVVMGEREVEPCYEKNMHQHRYFSMYKWIMENVPIERVIDLTVPALGITCTPFERFQRDCWIASRARACVTFGYGGAFCMATSFGKSVSYLNKPLGWVQQIFKNGFVDDCLATDDIELWVKTLGAA